MFEIELTLCIKMDLALNNLQRLICHKTQTTNQFMLHMCMCGKYICMYVDIYMYVDWDCILYVRMFSKRMFLSICIEKGVCCNYTSYVCIYRKCICMYVCHKWVCIVSVYFWKYIYIYACIYICMHVCMYAYACVYMCDYVRVYIL